MVGHRNCAVVGCGNSGAKLKRWMKKACPTHGCNQGEGHCDCVPPFVLFSFPTELRNKEQRQIWIKALNRKGDKGKNWEPNYDARVCSKHFIDGCPSDTNPDPVIDLGYTPNCKPKMKRKSPSVRLSSATPVPKKRKRHSDATPDLTPSASCDSVQVECSSVSVDDSLPSAATNYASGDKAEENDYDDERDTEINNLKSLVEKLKRDVLLWKTKFLKKERNPFQGRK